MDEQTIQQSVIKVLQIILQKDIPNGANFTRKDSEVWDSLKHIEVMFALEDEFAVEFSAGELAELDSVAQIVAAIQAKQ